MIPASACIAAYNEEKTIKIPLEYLTSLSQTLVDEILVCANACEDDTEKVVQSWSRTDKRVKLLTDDRPGKPNAWNTLVQNAKYNTLFFLDADIAPQQWALENIINAFDDNIITVGGRARATDFSGSLSSKCAAFMYGGTNQLHLAGSIYATRKDRLLEKMDSYDFKEMPSNIFAEDGWLYMIHSPGEFKVANNAVIHYNVGSLAVVIKQRARERIAEDELRENYPELSHNKLAIDDQIAKHDSLVNRFSQFFNQETWRLAIEKTMRYLGMRLFFKLTEGKVDKIYETLKEEYDQQGGAYILRSSARIPASKNLTT